MLKRFNIIAISGLKNSGKDEASKMLQYCLNAPRIFRNYWCYKHFNRLIPIKYSITSFAHPLKRTLASLLDIPINKFEDRSFKENTYIYFPTLSISKTPNTSLVISDNKFSKMLSIKDFSFLKTNWITIRQLLQCFGTEIMRGLFGEHLWILSTIKDKTKIIISDLRFKVEAETIKNKNGVVIYIKRDSCIPQNHASEKEVIELFNNNFFDYVVENNSTLKDLFNSIRNLV